MEKIKDYFKRYSDSNECYEADGKIFHTQGAAKSYSAEVKKYTRSAIEQTADFVDIDLNALGQKELKKYADSFGLKTENAKKETLVAALLEKQAELKQAKDDGDKTDE